MLSLVVLTRNEEETISNALKSVTCADEIVVVDDESADRTVEIAQSCGARVISHSLEGNFSQQRNFAMEQVAGDWILFLDADEELTPELNEQIKNVVSHQEQGDYYPLRRKDFFLGKPVVHGEVFDAYSKGINRLLRRGAGQWKYKIHEEFEPNPQSTRGSTLKGYVHHYPHQTVKAFLKNINHYSTLRAQELLSNGKRTNWFEVIAYPNGKFLLTYFLKGGFKDGIRGFVYSFMMSMHSFLVRAKLYMTQSEK